MTEMETCFKLDLTSIREKTLTDGVYRTGIFDSHRLRTALQPIYSLAHKRIVGHEALTRVVDADEHPVSPAQLFTRNWSDARMILLDRLTRWLHIRNFKLLNDPLNWLFLNISPQTLAWGREYGPFFKTALDAAGIPAHQVVIEVVEHPFEDEAHIKDAVDSYRELGCLIALDDFGAGHSNFNRIWTLKPDIVKLDRSFLGFLTQSDDSPGSRNMLPGIVSLLHQAGALVLMEGVETQEQALAAIGSDVDLVQGFYFGKPFTDLASPQDGFNGFSSLMDLYRVEIRHTETRFKENVRRYHALFTHAADLLRNGAPMSAACQKLLEDSRVVRCFRLGINGVQIGKTLIAGRYSGCADPRFRPLEDANSADWFRRHYLKRAVYHPEQIQVTRPYLSITGAHMCITLSMKLTSPSGDNVLCCDLMA